MSIGSIGSVSSYSFIDSMVKSTMNKSSQTKSKEIDFSQLASKIISKNDSDGDGSLSAKESTLSTKQFSALDTDANGTISSDELISGLQSNKPQRPNGPPPGGAPPSGAPPSGGPNASELASSIMENQDTDGDGSLSVGESSLSTENFNVLDTNKDGKVSADELTTGVKSRISEMESARNADSSATLLGTESQSDSESAIQTLLQTLTQNDASKAYGSQNWLASALQSATKTLALSA